MVAAIEQGYVQREIQDSAYALQRKIETGAQKIVGVNAYRVEREETAPTLRIDAEQERRARRRARRVPLRRVTGPPFPARVGCAVSARAMRTKT